MIDLLSWLQFNQGFNAHVSVLRLRQVFNNISYMISVVSKGQRIAHILNKI